MKRLSALLVGVLILATSLFAAAPVGATTAAPNAVAGSYAMTGSEISDAMLLHRNHTGIDEVGSTIKWSLKGKAITLVFTNTPNPGQVITFVGTVKRSGISSRRKPGTYSDNLGDSGTWYALKTS